MTGGLPWDRFGPEPTEPPAPVPEPPTPPIPVPSIVVTEGGSGSSGNSAGWSARTQQPASVPTPDIVKADAASRSKRTLIQGLLFDLFAAVIAAIAMLSGADPFVRETWIGFGILLIKSVVSAAISYFMRLRSTPTIRTKGEKLAIMPVPRPMLDNER